MWPQSSTHSLSWVVWWLLFQPCHVVGVVDLHSLLGRLWLEPFYVALSWLESQARISFPLLKCLLYSPEWSSFLHFGWFLVCLAVCLTIWLWGGPVHTLQLRWQEWDIHNQGVIFFLKASCNLLFNVLLITVDQQLVNIILNVLIHSILNPCLFLKFWVRLFIWPNVHSEDY